MAEVLSRCSRHEELSSLALSHPVGQIVGVSSRAGGVGKTTVASALGLIYDEALYDSGCRVAVVDQNINSPDQWGHLALAAEAPAVFEIMADIEAGRSWEPTLPRRPSLVLYPERRDNADAYSPGQIERFAARLRQLHILSVIDLPNRTPAYTAAEAAMCARWLAVADLVLLPTTDDPTRLRGVLEYLDAPVVRGGGSHSGMRVIVPCLRSPLRAGRENPGVRTLLAEIRARVTALVDIPSSEPATLATVRRRPVIDVHARLHRAYFELALAVARALLDP